MTPARCLAILAALLIGAPGLAATGAASGSVIWIALCDAAHPGRRIPLPLGHGRDDGGQACHAACAALADRRANRAGR